MFTHAITIAFLGWLACVSTYYAIQRHQVLPVIASATSTLTVIGLVQLWPPTADLHQMVWHGFWFGSSFCGMNNNRWVNFRNIHGLWLLYASFFALAYHYLPLPGGFLGTLALLASCIWILSLACLEKCGGFYTTAK